MNITSEVYWEEAIWKEINDAIVMEMGKLRMAQKVFHTTPPIDDNPENVPETIPNEVINFTDLSIKEGQTKQFVEIYHEFPLTATQVRKESATKTGKRLACSAAKALTLAEDTVFFLGQQGQLPLLVQADGIESAGNGLLGEADTEDSSNDDPNKVSEPIDVRLQANAKPGVLYGENTFSAIAEGIARLTAKTQAPNFAVFLPVKAYADTFVPPGDGSLVTTAERIKPVVEGGFMETVILPQDRGLLVALAGDPVSLYLGREASIEFVRKEGARYFLRVVERVQWVVRDPRSLVLLRFEQPLNTTTP